MPTPFPRLLSYISLPAHAWFIWGNILLLPSASVYAETLLSGYYSGHVNITHDAGSDMKKMGLQQLNYEENQQTLFTLFGTALTPPNGQRNTIPGRKVHGYPSNQKDTYLTGISIARQWQFNYLSTSQAHLRLGMINGVAEDIMRTSIDKTHHALGMSNLRHSPTSSEGNALLDLLFVHNQRLISVTPTLHLNGTGSVELGNLYRKGLVGFNIQLASSHTPAISGETNYIPWPSTTSQLYLGIYSLWNNYDRITDYAGTKKRNSFLVLGLHQFWQSWGISFTYTHYLSDLVQQQPLATDDYVQAQFSYQF